MCAVLSYPYPSMSPRIKHIANSLSSVTCPGATFQCPPPSMLKAWSTFSLVKTPILNSRYSPIESPINAPNMHPIDLSCFGVNSNPYNFSYYVFSLRFVDSTISLLFLSNLTKWGQLLYQVYEPHLYYELQKYINLALLNNLTLFFMSYKNSSK